MGDDSDTCSFGHTFQVNGGSPISDEVQSGEIRGLDDVRDAVGTDFLRAIMGDPWKNVKIVSGSQGTAYDFVREAWDKLDDIDYEVEKSQEKLFISPQSNMHQEFRQKRKQAEQNVKETMRSMQELLKQKHMLEHDIRKLRSRVEALESGDENQLKADFIELVDGAGAGGQGGDEASLKFLRDNNIYPSIVADFNEMDSLEDLEGDGKLANRPKNVKAVLKKKYSMYERWKDMYGSEVKRKLNELKGQLNRIERSIEENKEWLKPYVKDMVMIEQKDDSDYYDEMTEPLALKGYSTMQRNMEFVCYKGLKNDGEELIPTDSSDEITHYRVVYIHAVQVNLAPGDQPQSPSQGPSVAVLFWFPALVCKHVFERIFRQKIDQHRNRFDSLMEDYTGDFSTEEGDRFKEARQEKDLSVRELRERIEEEVGESVPLEVSSQIRRIEDGIDRPQALGEDYLRAVENVLDEDFTGGRQDEDMVAGFRRTLKEFVGDVDKYYIPPGASPFGEMMGELENAFYKPFKKDNGLYSM